MRSSRAISVVGCHAGGEVGNVVVGGVLPPRATQSSSGCRYLGKTIPFVGFSFANPGDRGGSTRT